MPLRTDLFGLFVPGNSKKGDYKRFLLGGKKVDTMPSILWGGIRSGPIVGNPFQPLFQSRFNTGDRITCQDLRHLN